MSTITVSCRQKPTSVNMLQWLSQYNLYTSIEEITGVFGFVQEYSPLYGGRIYYGAEITEEDLVFLQDKGLSLKLTLTSRIVSKKDYLDSREMLNKYYYHGNTIAAVNDNLARWIKRDFPNYIVEASVIKNIGWGDIEATLEIYDTIVLTMDKNDDLENLSKIKDKERIILFGNAGCAYTCPSKICYPSISKINKGAALNTFKCSKDYKEREEEALHAFDLDKLRDAGFNNFKFVPVYNGVDN